MLGLKLLGLLRTPLMLIAAAAALEPVAAGAGESLRLRAYVGTYTRSVTRGVYLLEMEIADGEVSAQTRLVADAENPSYLTLSSGGDRLYAVGEVQSFRGKRRGKVASYRVGVDGGLSELNLQPSAGVAPCYVSLDGSGSCLFAADYGTGTVASFLLDEEGGLSPAVSKIKQKGSSVVAARQKFPHAHCVLADPTNRYVLVTDLGADKIFVYRFDSQTGVMQPHAPPSLAMPPGAGPRHMAFHPSGEHLLVINELDGTLSSFRWDPEAGTLSPLDSAPTLPSDFDGKRSCADVRVHPNGRFVYGSNRGHDSLAVFRFEGATGGLAPVEIVPARVKTPRHFQLDPTGRFLLACGQDSNSIAVFAIDADTGRLRPVGEPVEAPTPVCLAFLPHGE